MLSSILEAKTTECKIVDKCGDLIKEDCRSELGGPLVFKTKSDKIIMCCGGCCDTAKRKGTQCSECPPKVWKECKEKSKK